MRVSLSLRDAHRLIATLTSRSKRLLLPLAIVSLLFRRR